MRNRQLPTVISNLLKKRLLLFLSFLLISSTMYGQQYTITVLANPTSGGTVIGGGTYDHGQSCTLTATPNWGYHFINWTENGSHVSTDTIYTFMVTGNRTLVANFQINNYTITTNVIPSGAGTVTGGGSNFHYGDQVTLTANANPGYIFSQWQDGNTQNPRTITVTGSATYTAVFTPNVYTITTNVTPEGAGTVTGGGPHNYGTQVILTASANYGYHFANWTENGNVVSYNANYEIQVTGNRTLVAHFEPNTYTITASISPTGTGSVTGEGTYNYMQTITLAATPINGYHFVNWKENGQVVANAGANYQFQVNGDRNLEANFGPNQYTITTNVTPAGAGTVTGGGTHYYGDEVTLEATASYGYHFSQWSDGVTQNPRTITVTQNATYTAQFAPNSYTITASKDPSNAGTVTGAGTYNYLQNCTLTATASYGYNFVNWTKNGTQVSSSPTYQFQVTESAEYVAHFTSYNYMITAIADPEVGGMVSGSGGYDYGQQCTLTATANTGYTFIHWTKNGMQVSSEPTYSFTVTEIATYIAHFQIIYYDITTNVTPANSGFVTGGGNYAYGTQVTLTASENYGFHFSQWSDGITQNPRQITVTQYATYTAVFTPNAYTITTNVTPTGAGTVAGGGTYNYGTTVTLTATANYGYHFDSWKESGSVVSNNASYTFQVEGNRTLEAHFEPNGYTINTDVTPTGAGTVTGGGTYTYGTTATLTASAGIGYHFLNWTVTGQVVPNVGANHTFQVTSDSTWVANFEINSYNINANANPSSAGTVTGSGTYTHGQMATLTATANQNSHYHFDHWQDNNTQNPRQITVMNNATYTAYFVLDQHTITVNASPENGGTVAGGGTYNYGSNTTLTATPAPGYVFQKWQEDDNTTNPRTITVNGDATYTAIFGQENYVIIVNAEPANGGTVTGGGAYNYGDYVILTATANSGYVFQSWNDGNTQNPRQITVTGNASYTAYFIGGGPTNYVVTATVSPEGAGSVTGMGVFPSGATTTLTAIPNAGYIFQRWNDNNTHNPRIITVNSNMQFTAYFTLVTYTINVNANPTNGGIVTGAGTYHYGDQATLRAEANEGYVFTHWQDGITTNPRTITVTQNYTYTANFEEVITPEYTITVNAEPANGGTVTGSGIYPEGTQVTLTATANPSYNFIQWDDGETQPQRQITVTGNATYTAFFERQQYTVMTLVEPEDGGTVTGGGTYSEGSEVTLTATPNPGSYEFHHWQDGVIENPRQITVTGDITYTATFTPIWYNITVEASPEECGMVEGGGQYMYGETCTVSATATPGYTFVNWTDENGYQLSNELIYSFIVTGNMTLVAHFAGEGQHIVYVDIDPLDGGTATGAGVYNDGEECTLKAFAKLGYHFVNWTRKETGEVVCEVPTYSFIVTETSRYVAHFERNKYTISAIANPEEGGTVSGYGIYYYGVTCTLTAEPNAYYEFLHWKNNDDIIVSETPDYTFQVTADASFTAYFGTNESYTISVSSNNSEWGTVEGGGTFNDGDICRLIAIPKEGYVFANWTEDGEVIPNAGPAYEFTVHRSRNLVANFTPDQYYIISAMASGNGSITPQGDIMVAVGGTQSFTMMPNDGCRIIKVLVDGLDVGPVESYTFTNVNRDHTIYAAFSGTGVEEAQNLDISIYPNPAKNKVYVEGDGIETMVLFDMFGNRMLNVDYNTSKELNVSGLPKGQYILVLTTRDGLVGYEKLVLH